MENVYGIFNGKITKVMPSQASKVFEGVILIFHNSDVTTAEAKYINSLFN
jgi:pyrroline-5-carboxylate reductase